MKLFTELNESVEILTEASDGGKRNYYIEGVFLQAEQKNRNGRVYPMSIMEREVNRYNREYVQKNRAFGELNHPSGPQINLERVSHMVTSLIREGNNYIGKAKIMTETPMGSIVKNLIDEGANLGVSSRGMCSLKESNGAQVVQNDFYLATAADIVSDPSAPDAFVRGIMEGKEWVYGEGGALIEVAIDEIQKNIRGTPSRRLDEEIVKAFQKLIEARVAQYKIVNKDWRAGGNIGNPNVCEMSPNKKHDWETVSGGRSKTTMECLYCHKRRTVSDEE